MAGNGSRAGSGRGNGAKAAAGPSAETGIGRRVIGGDMPARSFRWDGDGPYRTITRARTAGMRGTVKKDPWRGIPAGDRQGMREAIALRYGRRDPAVDAVRRRRR